MPHDIKTITIHSVSPNQHARRTTIDTNSRMRKHKKMKSANVRCECDKMNKSHRSMLSRASAAAGWCTIHSTVHISMQKSERTHEKQWAIVSSCRENIEFIITEQQNESSLFCNHIDVVVDEFIPQFDDLTLQHKYVLMDNPKTMES